MKIELLLIRVMIAITVGLAVFFLSILAGWFRAPRTLMINTSLDNWTYVSFRKIGEAIRERTDRGQSLPKSLGELSEDLREATFTNSNVKIIKNDVPVDGWGRPLMYSTLGTSYTLSSYGRDGVPGGTGFDRDRDSNSTNPIDYGPQLWSNPPLPSLREYLFELPTKGMIDSCYLSGAIAFVLCLILINPAPMSKRHAKSLAIRIGLTVLTTVIFALMIMGLHIPSGH